MMRKKFSAVELRRWARQCEKHASDPMITAWEREQLLKMKTALFDLARTEDWLNGIASVPTDPTFVEADFSAKTELARLLGVRIVAFGSLIPTNRGRDSDSVHALRSCGSSRIDAIIIRMVTGLGRAPTSR